MAMMLRRGEVWYLVYWVKDAQGKWRKVFRTTKQRDEAEARKMLDAYEAARHHELSQAALRAILADVGAKVEDDLELAGLWEHYLARAEKTGGARQIGYRGMMVRRFVRWMAERHPGVSAVRAADERIAAEYWRWLADEGVSPRTRNNIRAQLLVVWRGIMAESGLTVNPWELLQRDHGGGERYQILELAQIVDIYRAAVTAPARGVEPGFWPAAIQMGLYTGLREGDIAQLEWDELRPSEGVLILQPNKTKHWGKDQAAVHTMDAPWVGLLPPRPEEPARGYVWPQAARAARGSRGLGGFRDICRAAGVEVERAAAPGERRKRVVKLVTFHSLRHSFVTHLLRGGRVTERDLVQQGNWSTEAVVRGTYNHSKLEQARAAAQRVAKAMPEVVW
jgi:integrase